MYGTILDKTGIRSLSYHLLQKNIHPIKDWKFISFLILAIREFQPDIVTTRSSKAKILGRFPCKITNTPCILTAHGQSFTEETTYDLSSIGWNLREICEFTALFARNVFNEKGNGFYLEKFIP